MNPFQKKVMLKVGAMHLIVIGLMIFIPMLRGCFTPEKPKELITFIELGGPAPSVSVQSVESFEPIREPVQEAPPEVVEPPPPDPPAEIPKPPKEKKKLPPPKEVKKPDPPKKVEPKKKVEDPKKKWKPVDPSKIKIGPKVESKTTKPTIDTSAIQNQLKDWSKSSGSTSGSPSEFGAFYVQVRNTIYGYWKRPTSAASGSCTIVRVYMRKNGQITKRAKISGSGDLVYDRTVMDAVNAVSMLPKPPADYPYDYVEVEFILE